VKRIGALVVLSLGLLPSLATAQRGGADLKPEQAAQMYEDVEIMRRLLVRGLGSSALAGVNAIYHPTGPAPTTLAAGQIVEYGSLRIPAAVEGVYVKGHGVLFTVTLAATSRDPRPDGTRTEPKPDTDWERTRNQLRGEKVTTPDSTEKKEPSVGERVLALLAKNGHNFGELPADESITVVLVFRPDVRGNYPTTTWLQPTTLKGVVTNERNFELAGASGQAARDQQLLGDLHVKNGRLEDAIQAYTKALSVLGDDLNKPLTALQQHAEALEELYDKLVQTTAKSGKADVTRKLVERLNEWKKAKQSGPKPGALPARLTLSAPKKLLDQVGKDKLTFEEFKKAATVEYQTDPAGAK
jgi:hypothetical protein